MVIPAHMTGRLGLRLVPTCGIVVVLVASGGLIAAAGLNREPDTAADRQVGAGLPLVPGLPVPVVLRASVVEPSSGRVVSVSRSALDLSQIDPRAFGD
ncbi:MAG: hypothetical protein NW217_12185 [Hyphomicrobiaceae bacterium]|nr:hypothetical protein [Hyphomicrobiaceae bacterium]